MKMSRRAFSIGMASTVFSGLALSSKKLFANTIPQLPSYNQIFAYGELIPDPAKILDLPLVSLIRSSQIW